MLYMVNGGIYHIECLYVVCLCAESNPALMELREVSENDIKMKFAGLLSHACKKLEDKKVSAVCTNCATMKHIQ